VSGAARIVPPAAQGPGPLPRAVVDRLALAVGRRAAGLMAGDVRARGTGPGTEIEQVRPYQHGDDIRRLDPAASARTGVPHMRLHVPERTLTTWVVLDLSPSMAFGTADRLKSDVAAGVARVVAGAALRHAGRVGLLACGGAEPVVLPARGGRAALVALGRVVEEGVVPDGAGRPDALADALARLGVLARRPGLVAIVSDFPAGPALRGPLAAVAARHSVLAVEVRDRHELDLPAAGRLALVDPETGEHHEVEVDAAVRARFAARVREERDDVAALLRGAGAEHLVLGTGGDWLLALGKALA